MAHGTGRYLIRNYNADIKNEEYIVSFTRVRNYYYENMSDCYEPTWEDEDEYEATIRRWRTNRYGEIIADEISEGYRTGSIDKDTANKIYWNVKNRNLSFETCRAYFKKIAGYEIKA